MHGHVQLANTSNVILFSSGSETRQKMKDPDYLSQFNLNPEHQLIGSICSGALILAALGLLQDKQATTYPTAKQLLENFGVFVVERSLVIEDNVATAAGCLAAQDLAGWVIERKLGIQINKFRGLYPFWQWNLLIFPPAP